MFSKLKEKLKGALSIFSKKAEEEAVEVKTTVQETKTPIQETSPRIEPKVHSQKVKETSPLKEKHSPEKIISEKSSEKIVEEEKKPEIKVKEEKNEIKEYIVKEGKLKEKKIEQILKQNPEIKEKKEIKEEVVEKNVETNILEHTEEPKEQSSEKILTQEQPNEKKSFFGKFFGKKEEKKDTKEIIEEKKKEEKETKQLENKEEETFFKEEKSIETEKVAKEKLPATSEEPEKEPEKKGIFGKVKEALTTKTISSEKFEELFWDLELALLENNVSVEVIEKIKEDLKQELVDKPLPRDVEAKILETLKQTVDEILSFPAVDILSKVKEKVQENKPLVIALFGINGAGKTTSLAKMTHYFQKHNHSVVLAAGDTFRAAAIQQLEEHASKLNVKIIKHEYGSDSAAVAFDAIRYAEKNKIEVVLIDTAGRLHSNTNLMDELKKIIKVAKPDINIFVGESITGNDCIEQARKFNELVNLDGLILTKADVDEKGGAPLSIAYTIKKPILFLGVGQSYDDWEVFDKEKILGRLGL
ncbi:signal recognition particle-docking protein FtsY [Candidatus Woesearchaeota archaeon]|nr:signal recognition particle-docking protein FtsY [Candidatus Woesearchaeota archaeon]